jgi:hypothetical protein
LFSWYIIWLERHGATWRAHGLTDPYYIFISFLVRGLDFPLAFLFISPGTQKRFAFAGLVPRRFDDLAWAEEAAAGMELCFCWCPTMAKWFDFVAAHGVVGFGACVQER